MAQNRVSTTTTNDLIVFTILSLALAGFLLLESFALLVVANETAMAVVCRLFIAALLIVVYRTRNLSNAERLAAAQRPKKTKRKRQWSLVTEWYNWIILVVALLSLLRQFVLLCGGGGVVYSFVVVTSSLVSAADEVHCLWWLRQREDVSRHSLDDDDGEAEERRSLYYQCYQRSHHCSQNVSSSFSAVDC